MLPGPDLAIALDLAAEVFETDEPTPEQVQLVQRTYVYAQRRFALAAIECGASVRAAFKPLVRLFAA